MAWPKYNLDNELIVGVSAAAGVALILILIVIATL